MRRPGVFFVVLFATFALLADAKPDSAEPLVSAPPAITPAQFPVDTLYILGGPDRWDGSFETPFGQPDWHGWTHKDLTSSGENTWHISTYWAENLGGHGPGNHAMYCGDETIPACAPDDTIGGYGNQWRDDLQWRNTTPNPGQPVTVRLTGFFNYDLPDVGWDFLEIYVQRGEQDDRLAYWTGTSPSFETLDITTVLSPGEFSGPDQDEVVLWWRVWTDGGYSDADCLSPGHGAAQIDDITVYLDDVLITFDDFEAGSPVSWIPVQDSGVGDFAHLRNKLGDNDPCDSNTSYQVNFIDDGIVVPGTGGTNCIDHCYDPSQQIVNNTGGLQAEDPQTVFLHNQIYSPPVAWVPGNHGAELSYDVYLDEAFQHPDDAGIFFEWFVRSTSSPDPADLENASWQGSGNLFYGGPDYQRNIWPVHHKLVPDPLWVQIALGVNEFGHNWGINGLNGTPAPYVDNVAFKIWNPSGPEILIKSRDLFSDTFPENGSLNPNDLAANWCRVDIQGTVYVDINHYVLGDSLEAEIKPIRKGATVPEPASLHWVMSCNPTFDSVRPQVPDGQGLLRGMVTGGVVLDYHGQPRENVWSFDLPDTGFFFPGDMLHYYLTASDDLDGDVRTSVWPPDTTGVLDFNIDSLFPSETTATALPTITQPEAGQFSHPSLLFCDGTAGSSDPVVWFDALQELGFRPGLDYDLMNVHKGPTGAGLGAQTTVPLLAEYQTLVYTSGASYTSLSGIDWSNDAKLVADWLATGEKQALLVGDHFVDGLHVSGDGSSLMYQLGVGFIGGQIADLNGGMRDLQVSPVAGSGVLPDDWSWSVFAGCPDLKNFDAINTAGDGQVSATLDPAGLTGGPYAALVTVDDTALANRTAVMPFDLVSVTSMAVGPSKDRTEISARAYLLNYLLFWLGAEGITSVDNVPGIGKISVTAHPNPFNPQTTIAFDLPRAMEVSLDIFDLQGRLVKSLLQSSPHPPGRHDQVWDGRDAKGQATASGVYFYKFTAGEQDRVGKLTLLK